MKVILGQRFSIIKKIAKTRFSTIYLGQDLKSNNYVALKLEPFNSDIPQLDIEYNFLQRFQSITGFPKLYHYGYESDYKLLVIDYFKYSLQDLFEKCHCRFSLKTVLMITDQIISRIEYIHKYDQIHRDIKPENFMFNEKEEIIYAIDFGFFKRCPQIRLNRSEHTKFKKKSFTGTLRYASINAMNGKDQYKRDDLESLAYMLIYFLKGNLPWSEESMKNKSRLQYKTKKLEDTQTRIELAIENNYITEDEAELMVKNRITPIKHSINSKYHQSRYTTFTPDYIKPTCKSNSALKSTPVSFSNTTSNYTSKTASNYTSKTASNYTSKTASNFTSKTASNFTSKTTSNFTSNRSSRTILSSLSTPADFKNNNNECFISDRKRILDIKKEISPEILCQNLPEEFCLFLKLVRSLRANDVPKYEQYRMMFRDLFIRSGFIYDGKYDWNFVYEEQKSLPVIKPQKTSYSRPVTRLPSPRNGTHSQSSIIKKQKIKYTPVINNTRLVSNSLLANNNESNSIENYDENDPELISVSMDDDTNSSNYFNRSSKSKTTISSPRTKPIF